MRTPTRGMRAKPALSKRVRTPPAVEPDADDMAGMRARVDFGTLKEHAQITSDPSRHKAAIAHGQSEMTAMQKALKKKPA